MLVNSLVAGHLRKYFDLACVQYEKRSWGLAAFFAVTLIEECAKILVLRDADLDDMEQRWNAIDHTSKFSIALINLLDASDHFDGLPKEWQDLAWSWFSGEKLMYMRNRSLYLWFTRRKELITPDVNLSEKEASLLVYLSGFVVVELSEYVDLDSTWVKDMLRSTEDFRGKYLDV